MILLDTHIWVWLVGEDPALPQVLRKQIDDLRDGGLGVSVISAWEVAKKVEIGKLRLDRDAGEWIQAALAWPGIELVPLTPEIAVESTRLPQPFHRDPADQMLVATARILGVPLLTLDARLHSYPHVPKIATASAG